MACIVLVGYYLKIVAVLNTVIQITPGTSSTNNPRNNQQPHLLDNEKIAKAIDVMMFVFTWSLPKCWGNSWLRGPSWPNKKPKLLKLHSTIVIKMIHEYAPSCSKNSAEVAMSMHQPLVNTIIFN